MPVSNTQLAAVLFFFLALTLPFALYFMPSSEHVFSLVIGYACAGGGIAAALLA
jgi:hypothetical protein